MKHISKTIAVLAAFAGAAGVCGAVFAANGQTTSNAPKPSAPAPVPQIATVPYQLQFQVATYILTEAAWDAIPPASKTNAQLLSLALVGVATHYGPAPTAITFIGTPVTLRSDIALPVAGQNSAIVFSQWTTVSGQINADNSIALQLDVKDTAPGATITAPGTLTQNGLTTSAIVQSGQPAVVLGYAPGAGTSSTKGDVCLTVVTTSISTGVKPVASPAAHP